MNQRLNRVEGLLGEISSICSRPQREADQTLAIYILTLEAVEKSGLAERDRVDLNSD